MLKRHKIKALQKLRQNDLDKLRFSISKTAADVHKMVTNLITELNKVLCYAFAMRLLKWQICILV
jgi:hypothetical protein